MWLTDILQLKIKEAQDAQVLSACFENFQTLDAQFDPEISGTLANKIAAEVTRATEAENTINNNLSGDILYKGDGTFATGESLNIPNMAKYKRFKIFYKFPEFGMTYYSECVPSISTTANLCAIWGSNNLSAYIAFDAATNKATLNIITCSVTTIVISAIIGYEY